MKNQILRRNKLEVEYTHVFSTVGIYVSYILFTSWLQGERRLQKSVTDLRQYWSITID